MTENTENTETKDSAKTAKPKSARKKKPSLPSNIQFIGRIEKLNKKTGKMEKVLGTPSKHLNAVEKVFKMGDPKQQIKGFYHKDASAIINEFPELYKPVIAKG